MFEIVDEENEDYIVDTPSSELQTKMVRSNYISKKGVSVETFQPVTMLREDSTGDKLLVYKRTVVPNHLVKRDNNGDVIASDTLKSGLSTIGKFLLIVLCPIFPSYAST